MGEIAEMMLDGTLCEGCGVYIGDGGSGFPRYCSAACARDRGVPCDDDPPRSERRTHQCKTCRRYFRGEQGLRDHQRVKGHQ